MRYFLLDLVTELVVGERAVGVKNVTLTDEVVHDHFPDYPTMPGALIVEAASQLAGFLLEMTFDSGEGRVPRALLMQIKNARFYEMTGPGDQLIITVTLANRLARAANVEALVTVEGKKVATARLTFVMKDIDSEKVHEQRRYVYKLWTRKLEQNLVFR